MKLHVFFADPEKYENQADNKEFMLVKDANELQYWHKSGRLDISPMSITNHVNNVVMLH